MWPDEAAGQCAYDLNGQTKGSTLQPASAG
jgi:hypothetical protein